MYKLWKDDVVTTILQQNEIETWILIDDKIRQKQRIFKNKSSVVLIASDINPSVPKKRQEKNYMERFWKESKNESWEHLVNLCELENFELPLIAGRTLFSRWNWT